MIRQVAGISALLGAIAALSLHGPVSAERSNEATCAHTPQTTAKEAVAACRQRLKGDLTPAEAARTQASLAWALIDLGDLKGAWRAAQVSTALSPAEPGGYEARAAMALRLNQTADALSEIDKARPYGLTYDGHVIRSRILQKLKRYDEAIAEADSAIRLHPEWSPPYVSRGVAQHLKGDPEAALESYRLAEKIDPASAVISMNIAFALRALNRDDEVLRYTERTIELNPKDVRGYHQRAWLRRRAGDLPGALEDYQRALRMAPKDSDIWLGVALVQSQMGRYDEAIRTTDRAQRLAPMNSDVWGTRCWISAVHNRDLAARRADCDRALTLSPASSDHLQTRAFARQRAGDPVGALADAEAAIDRDPTSADAYYIRGWIRAQQGHPDAKSDLVAALKIDPRVLSRHERLGLGY